MRLKIISIKYGLIITKITLSLLKILIFSFDNFCY